MRSGAVWRFTGSHPEQRKGKRIGSGNRIGSKPKTVSIRAAMEKEGHSAGHVCRNF